MQHNFDFVAIFLPSLVTSITLQLNAAISINKRAELNMDSYDVSDKRKAIITTTGDYLSKIGLTNENIYIGYLCTETRFSSVPKLIHLLHSRPAEVGGRIDG